MKKKPVIAILCKYPSWLHCSHIPVQKGHYEVWHVSMHDAFANDDEFEIHRIVLDKNVKKQIDFVDKGEHFHILPRSRGWIGLFTGYAMDRIRVARLLKQLKPDLVHAWGTEYCYGLCALDFHGKKLLSLQGHLTAYVKMSKMSKFEYFQSFYEPCIFRKMPLITTESEWGREQILKMNPKAKVLLWDYAPETCFLSEARDISEQPNCVLSGYNTPRKNIGLAVKAFSRPELSHVKLYLAGTYENDFENLPPNIIPLGAVERDDLVKLLKQTWALVHPTLADTCPNAVKEARVMGIPAIVTHECGAKQYVVHGKSGFVIDAYNEQELVDAVLSTTKDASTSIFLGKYDQDRCREALSTKTMVDGIRHIYQGILSDSSV
ncbi:MAG: glycosyltransferase family 4 protein [Akkermansia sp.]|nr:glycosyltransferase family 4 protein [Akkermansia sp.]